MDYDSSIKRVAQALTSLNSALPQLLRDAPPQEQLSAICSRELFTPDEDEAIGYWFARFTTVRRTLWSIVEEGIQTTGGLQSLSEDQDYQYFVLAYSAVCSLIRMDYFLVNKIANHTVIQRKLNEAFPNHRIERKQFSEIYQALVDPGNAIRIHQAHRTLKRKAKRISNAVKNTPAEPIFQKLAQQERFLNLSWRQYFKAWLRSRKLVWRRRGASARQQSLFTVLEYSGRLASELALPRVKKVTPSIKAEIQSLLRPGDIFVTRHSRALTNLFLPGYWPHAALYVGYATDRESIGIESKPKHMAYWEGDNCMLEALKDGVHFRPLAETLSVDAFVLIRPNLAMDHIATALSRVSTHAGKGYNFDFDFFRSDQLVCTEVVYRAYDGVNNFQIPLQERMGRKTLSAEDLLDLALDSDWAEPIAIFGVGESKHALVTGTSVKKVLAESYRF